MLCFIARSPTASRSTEADDSLHHVEERIHCSSLSVTPAQSKQSESASIYED